jgi:hypothetical protein
MPQTYIRAVSPGAVGRMRPVAVSWSRNGRDVPGTRGRLTEDQVRIPSTLSAATTTHPGRWDPRVAPQEPDRTSWVPTGPRRTTRSPATSCGTSWSFPSRQQRHPAEPDRPASHRPQTGTQRSQRATRAPEATTRTYQTTTPAYKTRAHKGTTRACPTAASQGMSRFKSASCPFRAASRPSGAASCPFTAASRPSGAASHS